MANTASIYKRFRTHVEGVDADGKQIRKHTREYVWFASVVVGESVDLDGKAKKVRAAFGTNTADKKKAEAQAAAWQTQATDAMHAGKSAKEIADAIRAGRNPVGYTGKSATCGALFDEWLPTLANRSADDDKSRAKNYLRPEFDHVRIVDIKIAHIMRWVEKQRAMKIDEEKRAGRRTKDGKLSDATIRHNLNLLSRFFSWAIGMGYAERNPVRDIPQGKRPRQSSKKIDAPWISDDKQVRDLMNALATPFREMFYIGNRSGLRPGEVRGWRMSDAAWIADEEAPCVRVRFSDDGPRKEDKHGDLPPKFAPAPDDIEAVLGPLLAKRQAEGAGPDDYVFAPELTRCAVSQRMADAWKEATDATEIDIDLYGATRHSFVSRNRERGAALQEVSAAVGHADERTTRRHYDLYVPKKFSPTLRQGLGFTADNASGTLLPFSKKSTG